MRTYIEESAAVLVGGHRGCRGGRTPENTLEAFAEAARQGAHYIETDIQLTRDGELVIQHDFTVDDPATGEPRAVYDCDFAYLRQTHGIRSIDGLLEWLAASGMHAALEIKSDPSIPRGGKERLIDALVDRLRSFRAAPRVFVFSIDHPLMAYARERDAGLTTGLIVPTPPADPLSLMQRSGADIYLSRVANLSPGLVERLRGGGYLVSGGDINGADVLLADRYEVNMFETDCPEQAIQLLRTHGRTL